VIAADESEVKVGVAVMVIAGVVPPELARLPLAVTFVTGAVTRAASGMPVKFVPVRTGAVLGTTHVAHAIVAVPPTVEAPIGALPATAVIVPPPLDPHALPVVVNNPPVPVCTHWPAVSPPSVIELEKTPAGPLIDPVEIINPADTPPVKPPLSPVIAPANDPAPALISEPTVTAPANVGLDWMPTVTAPLTVDAVTGAVPATDVIIPPPDPHAEPVIVSKPPVLVCTH
jgi:hypothetical protein